jgi:tRNA threonylcarbamoyladenosine biosynthesis protein TsaB
LIVVVRAGRGRLIAAQYEWLADRWQQCGDFELMTIEQLVQTWNEQAMLCGELSAAEREIVEQRLSDRVRLGSPAQCVRRAGYLAELGWQRIQSGQSDDPARLQPIYVAAKAAEGTA